MIASLSARLIAEEWADPWITGSPDINGEAVPFDLGWLDRLALARPHVYARLAPKIARMVRAGLATEGAEREAYGRAFAVMRETLAAL
jgi:hypothetical protein